MKDTTIIDGKYFAGELRKRIKYEVKKIEENNKVKPGLAVILVGENPASQVYVRNKARQTVEVGMNSFEHKLETKTSESDLLKLIDKLNTDKMVNGILVQLPLPDHIDEATVLSAVKAEKDVDGFHFVNAGHLASGHKQAIVPCTPLGCLMLIKNQISDLSGLKGIVLGRSNIVGKPMAQLLLSQNCTVTIAHSRTKNLAYECREADILIAAVGCAQLVSRDWVKPGAIVIDVGINRISVSEGSDEKTKLVGDVDFDSVVKVAGAITPVPGGVGPMTIACLLHNTLYATCLQNDLIFPEF